MTFRPRVEALESREVPASLTWTGEVSNVFENGSNWRDSYTGSQSTQAPAAGDHLSFVNTFSYGDPESPTVIVTSDCVGMRDLTGAYASVTLTSGFTRRVTVTATLTTGSLTLRSGTLDQSSGSANITATSAFTWTGGTLNSTANDANVTIAGSGTITLPTGGTLSCGSTLNFTNPTAAAVETVISGAGTLLLNGLSPDGVFVGADAKVKMIASPGTENWIDSVNKTLTLDFGGEWGYVGTGPSEMHLRVINNGGKLYLEGQVNLKLTGGNATTAGYTQNPPGITHLKQAAFGVFAFLTAISTKKT